MRRASAFVLFLAAAGAQEPTVDFVEHVAPILQQRCVSCHGPDKQKGSLRLDRKEFLFVEGEEDWWTVIPGKPDESLMIERVELPAGHEDIMPNQGEPLRAEQIAVLRRWIAAGAEWPEAADAWFAEAAAAAEVPRIEFGIEAPSADAQARVDAAIAALRDRGVVAGVVAADTPAVDVNASLVGADFTDADLKLLQGLEPVLVWLNLAGTAVTDAGLEQLAVFRQLRRVNLSRSGLGDGAAGTIAELPRLETVNFYGTELTDAGLQALAGAEQLRKVYAFDTGVTAEGVAGLTERDPPLVVDRGEYVQQRLEAAAAEIAEREQRNRPVNDTCPVTGKPVDVAQAIDHDGLRIAFCCGECLQKFQDAPGEFAEQVAKYRKQAGEAGREKGEQGKE